MKLQNFGILRNVLGSFQKSSEIVGISRSDRLCRIKISRPWPQKKLAGIGMCCGLVVGRQQITVCLLGCDILSCGYAHILDCTERFFSSFISVNYRSVIQNITLAFRNILLHEYFLIFQCVYSLRAKKTLRLRK